MTDTSMDRSEPRPPERPVGGMAVTRTSWVERLPGLTLQNLLWIILVVAAVRLARGG